MSSPLLICTSGWTRRKCKTIIQCPAASLPEPESERQVDFPVANITLIKANFRGKRKQLVRILCLFRGNLNSWRTSGNHGSSLALREAAAETKWSRRQSLRVPDPTAGLLCPPHAAAHRACPPRVMTLPKQILGCHLLQSTASCRCQRKPWIPSGEGKQAKYGTKGSCVQRGFLAAFCADSPPDTKPFTPTCTLLCPLCPSLCLQRPGDPSLYVAAGC